LVSTISFSGLERMDYSLAGNNVLKDHSQPSFSGLHASLQDDFETPESAEAGGSTMPPYRAGDGNWDTAGDVPTTLLVTTGGIFFFPLLLSLDSAMPATPPKLYA
jgi:hypothetical protein